MNSLNADRLPVIVGVGQVKERSRDPQAASEPLALMQQALAAAESDAAPGLLAALDSIDIVAEHSWPYADAPGLLSARLGITPRRAEYGVVGGESPVRFIHEAALRIARGESEVAAVVGAESTYAVAAAKKAGVTLPWTPRDRTAHLIGGEDLVNPIALRNGVFLPAQVYPFYENAALADWGQTPREALAETGRVWGAFSEAAAANPHAWSQKLLTPEQITTPDADNRLIAWPYTKFTVANPMVNQGAAVLLTSLARARQAGVPEDRLVYIWGGAAAAEPRDYLKRDQYQQSHAQNAVMKAAADLAGGDARAFGFIELYSCFPCVPKMARRSLGLPEDARMSVAGGLSFFGAPLNNYMTHAAAALVGALRGRGDGALALLYGQGEYVTKHHALVLSTRPDPYNRLVEDYKVNAAAQAATGPVPELIEQYEGPAKVETFTVIYGREGQAEFGSVIARTPDGKRLMARVPRDDQETIAFLTRLDESPIGADGNVSPLDKGLLAWRR